MNVGAVGAVGGRTETGSGWREKREERNRYNSI